MNNREICHAEKKVAFCSVEGLTHYCPQLVEKRYFQCSTVAMGKLDRTKTVNPKPLKVECVVQYLHNANNATGNDNTTKRADVDNSIC